jgi:hypothetical protein
MALPVHMHVKRSALDGFSGRVVDSSGKEIAKKDLPTHDATLCGCYVPEASPTGITADRLTKDAARVTCLRCMKYMSNPTEINKLRLSRG